MRRPRLDLRHRVEGKTGSEAGAKLTIRVLVKREVRSKDWVDIIRERDWLALEPEGHPGKSRVFVLESRAFKVRNALVLLTQFVMAGCTAIETSPYPPQWPGTVRLDGKCREISGVYQSRAEHQTYQHPQSDRLLAIMLLPVSPRLEGVSSVSLRVQADGALWIRAYDEGQALLTEHVYPADGGIFRCNDGELEFLPAKKPGRERAADTPMVGVTWERVTLRKAATGALVMQTASGATGMAFLVVPVHARSVQWYLFMPASTPPK